MKTKKEFEKYFRQETLPAIRREEQNYGPGIDYPMRREEWNNIIDMMVTNKELPKRALDWSCPW